MNPRIVHPRNRSRRGSVLIIVLWVAFGLVTLALYFGESMNLEMRASDNRVAAVEADQAIAGAMRYVSNYLATAAVTNVPPDVTEYKNEAVPVGDATFWLIGRGDEVTAPDRAVYGLIDEGSRLNLNTVTYDMMSYLPNMTPELAAAIIDWRDADSDITENGAEDEAYLRLNPPYHCKNAPFESVDELRLVYGADLEILYGEDTNLNGILDPNENDGDLSPPSDNRDGRLDPGIVEYFTVYTRQPATGTNVNNTAQITALLSEELGDERANQVRTALGGRTNFTSLLEFYIVSGLDTGEFQQIEGLLTTTNGVVQGLVNPNTASEAVLTCIPGIGPEFAATLVGARRSNPIGVQSIAWVSEALPRENAITAGRHLTSRSYQLTADIAAVGHYGRGYERLRVTFDTSDGTPRVVRRQELTHLGWALDSEARGNLKFLTSNTTRQTTRQ